MTRLSNTVNQFDMSWDEYVIAVEDSYLIEAEADLTEEQYRDVSTAFDIGMTPIGCAIALMEARRHRRPATDWRMAA
ncbi:hypothetical protein T8K17_22870 [Thalassobaculum sp. OXR-137]|uniref:hypothetical protein n=1 Tax=Thalassobaculum sp. OXR-137 TaxID=3100173 RepID=UPI002AC9CEF9|nr:hypothetical protein [Thalassobaculum sp. OXR-137]WPZ34067.1 hypothetical protein T8K17_22870 [Thalassobaculum sp. OXR-137]